MKYLYSYFVVFCYLHRVLLSAHVGRFSVSDVWYFCLKSNQSISKIMYDSLWIKKSIISPWYLHKKSCFCLLCKPRDIDFFYRKVAIEVSLLHYFPHLPCLTNFQQSSLKLPTTLLSPQLTAGTLEMFKVRMNHIFARPVTCYLNLIGHPTHYTLKSWPNGWENIEGRRGKTPESAVLPGQMNIYQPETETWQLSRPGIFFF